LYTKLFVTHITSQTYRISAHWIKEHNQYKIDSANLKQFKNHKNECIEILEKADSNFKIELIVIWLENGI